ncbi:MAG: hypothetical protein IPH88_07585 [Bacteroidales bacterium]|nr:hypothetical protein [Bacteroidales bacterium]
MMAQQLDTELNELKVLEKIDPNKKIEIVGFGAVVFSQDQNYFVAISSGKIEIGSQLFYAISAKVPIYQALQGKNEVKAVNSGKEYPDIRYVLALLGY